MRTPLNQFSKEELQEMHEACVIYKCMRCGKYHYNDDQFTFKGNISTCEECRKRVKNEK